MNDRYKVRAFTTYEAMEAWLNSEDMRFYRAVSIADTDACITVMVERSGGFSVNLTNEVSK